MPNSAVFALFRSKNLLQKKCLPNYFLRSIDLRNFDQKPISQPSDRFNSLLANRQISTLIFFSYIKNTLKHIKKKKIKKNDINLM